MLELDLSSCIKIKIPAKVQKYITILLCGIDNQLCLLPFCGKLKILGIFRKVPVIDYYYKLTVLAMNARKIERRLGQCGRTSVYFSPIDRQNS